MNILDKIDSLTVEDVDNLSLDTQQLLASLKEIASYEPPKVDHTLTIDINKDVLQARLDDLDRWMEWEWNKKVLDETLAFAPVSMHNLIMQYLNNNIKLNVKKSIDTFPIELLVVNEDGSTYSPTGRYLW